MANTFGANDPSTLQAVAAELRNRARNLRTSVEQASAKMNAKEQAKWLSRADFCDSFANDLQTAAEYGPRSANEDITQLQRQLGIRPYTEGHN